MSQSQPIIPVTMPYYSEPSSDGGHQRILSEISRESANIVSNINSQATNEATREHASQVETRQSIERNADQIQAQAQANSIAEILTTQNTSTATQLGVQNTATVTQLGTQTTATATQLGVQNTSTVTQLGTQTAATAIQLAVQNTSAVTGNAIRDASFATSASLSALSVQAERINGLNVIESKNIQVNQGRDLGAMQLLAAQNFGTLQLQASESKGFLTNHITATSDNVILKSAESETKILEKIAECCCENKMLHRDTQQVISSSEASALRTELAKAQQEALIARLTPAHHGRS